MMTARSLSVNSLVRIAKHQLQVVLDTLKANGYCTIGPRVVDSAIVYRELDRISQLPIGLIDRQDGGIYRLEKGGVDDYFDYVVGPDSLKGYLFPSRETVLESHRKNGQWEMSPPTVDASPLAVIGLRSCDLHALAIQDKVFMGGLYVDPSYQARRQNLFIVAVNCRRAAPTCFCHSMGTGPSVQNEFDLALTELDGGFVVEVGTPRGRDIIAASDWTACTLEDMEDAARATSELRQQMHRRNRAGTASYAPNGVRERSLDTTDIHDLLLSNLEHPRWAEVATRCLSCANCTMVCPTCFCASVNDVSNLAGDHVCRERAWDSCFTAEHSYMNTGTVRRSTASRYRQWLTHKLATWSDQFGESGCVGCGRCITWCPVGIDLTEEVAAIRGGMGDACAGEEDVRGDKS